MHTEEQAKKLWCPMVRMTVTGAFTSSNRFFIGIETAALHENPDGCHCIASKCSMWRWDRRWSGAVEEGEGGDLVLRLKRNSSDPVLGFCGLAGSFFGEP